MAGLLWGLRAAAELCAALAGRGRLSGVRARPAELPAPAAALLSSGDVAPESPA